MQEANSPLSLLSILPETPEEQILLLLIQLAVEMVGADEGSILVLDESTQELVFAMTVGSTNSEQKLRGQRVPLGKGIAGLAAITREVQTGAPTYGKIQQPQEPAAVLAAPMLVNDNVVGVITAVRFTPELRFRGREVELYSKFAGLAGTFVELMRRLTRIEAAHLPSPGEFTSEQQELENQIIASVRHLVKVRPDGLRNIAAMLRAIENVVSPH